MVNMFIGWSQDDLEAALRRAQEDYAAGKTLTEVSGGDASSKKMITVDVRKRIEQLMFALNDLDPNTYPLTQIRRVTRTRTQIFTPGGEL